MDSGKLLFSRGLPEDRTFGTIDRLFDFTLRFQDYIFTIPLALCVILATPAFITRAVHRKPCIESGALLRGKGTVVATLTACELANVIIYATNPSLRSVVSITAAVLSFGASICTTIVLYVAHAYSIQPSTFLSVYLAIAALCDIVRCRSYFIRTGLAAAGGLAAAFVVLKLSLAALEEVSKARLVKATHHRKPLGKEFISGFWNRSLFIWLNPTLILGFKKDITINELPDPGPEFDSEDLYDRFEPNWENRNKHAKFSLGLACISTLQWEFVAIFIPRLCSIGFRFGQPFLMWRLINFIGESEQPVSVKAGLIGATFFIYFGMAITTVYFEHLNYRMATFVRGILVSAIFRKTLKLNHDQLKQSSALTLMSTDITGIERMFPLFHDTWASVVELSIGLYILTTYLGAAAFLVLIPIGVMAAITTHISKKMGKARSGWNLKIEERVAITKKVLAQIKSIKATGLAPMISELLQRKRLEEIQFSSKERLLRVFLHVLQGMAEGITPVAVVAGGMYWTRKSLGLSTADIFTTLSVVAIISGPLSRILVCMPFFVGSVACLGRIQQFLLLEEVEDKRIIDDDDTPEGATTIVEKPFGGVHAKAKHAFQLQGASITLPENETPLIKNANMKDDKRGDVSMIYGPVGCGKSTLLNAVIGEAAASSGQVRLGTRYVAYCDQTAWLQNASIRDNIIAQTPYIAERYKDVLYCCDLDEDLKQLPEGDKTMVGSRGTALSGGQRQRVALARAMYACAALLVIDDAISALDMTTAREILARMFRKNSTVRMFDTSVIMTTNILEHLPLADVVYSISETGDLKREPNISAFVRDTNALLGANQPVLGNYHEDSDASRPSLDVNNPDIPDLVDLKDPNLGRRKGDMSLYHYYMKEMGWHRIALWTVLVTMTGAAEKIPQIFLRIWFERDPNNAEYFGGFAALSIVYVLLTLIMTFVYYLSLVPTASNALHLGAVKTIVSAKLSFLSSTDSGSILNRFSQDMTFVAQLLPRSLLEVAFISVIVVFTIGIIGSGASYAAAIIPVFFLALYFIQRFYLRTSRQMRLLELESKAMLFTHFAETSDGIRHIRAFEWQPNFTWQCHGMLDYSQKPYYYMFCIQRWLTVVLELTTCAIAVVLVTVAVCKKSSSSETAIGLAMLNLIVLSQLLNDLMNGWIVLETSLGAISRIRQFNKTTPVEKELDVAPSASLDSSWPATGGIQFRDVTARYNSTGARSEPTLKDITYSIEPGQKFAVIGRTGSGKSTFILSILNLLEYSGTITIDGIDIKEVPKSVLRSRITTISQDCVELPTSVRVNLAPFEGSSTGEKLSDDDLERALARVNLLDVVKNRGGLDTSLESMALSPGQSQLLCLARAILMRNHTGSKIVLIDEATSSTDMETDKRLQTAMAEEFADCTVISVTHRHEGVKFADFVIAMSDGKISKTLDRRAIKEKEKQAEQAAEANPSATEDTMGESEAGNGLVEEEYAASFSLPVERESSTE